MHIFTNIKVQSQNIGILLLLIISFLVTSKPKFISPLLILIILFLWYNRSDRKYLSKEKRWLLLPLLVVIEGIILLFFHFDEKTIALITFKFGLIAFPFIVYNCKSDIFKTIKAISTSIFFGLVFNSIYCLFRAFYISISFIENKFTFNTIIKSAENNYPILKTYSILEVFQSGYSNFSSSNFSVLIHPSYYSLLITFSLLLFIEYSSKSTSRLILLVVVSYFFVIQFLLGSKLGFIIYILMLSYFFIKLILNKYLSVRIRYLAILLSFVVAILMSKFNYRLLNEISKTLSYIENNELKYYNNGNNNFLDRLSIWSNSLQLIKSNFWFGVGSGNVRSELAKQMEKNGLKELAALKNNCHNQFLETFLGIGIFGFLTLLAIFGLGFYYAIKNKDPLLFVFISSMFLFGLVESFLNTVAGVMFFSFFYNLLIVLSIEKARLENEKTLTETVSVN
jgi:O-antigen ligase